MTSNLGSSGRNNGILAGGVGGLGGVGGRARMRPVERCRPWTSEREGSLAHNPSKNSNSFNQSVENKIFIGQGASNGLL